MATKKRPAARNRPRTSPRSNPTRRTPSTRFVGRDASPVLDRYPPKDVRTAVRAPATVVSSPNPPPAAPARPATPADVGQPLITLDRPFNVDEFSSLLGETSIRLTVPREALGEVLRRALEFMEFGIYVYAISVRPAPAELLKSFVVELQRVDYSAEKGAWVVFVEKGVTDSPFGPSGNRT